MSNSSSIVEVHWIPKHADRFVARGSEISLYQVKPSIDADRELSTNININLSLTATATILASETRYQYIRCISPSYNVNNDPLLAVGLDNGKVALCNFVSSTENNIEYTPRQSRPCLTLAWHEQETNLLAMGHDRNRSDHCITVWDTEKGAPKESSILHLLGLSETAHSICWDKHQKLLIAGMSHKYIKMMDLRQNNSVVNILNSRAVHGVKMAPNGRYFSSFVDNIIGLWDLRNTEKPVSHIQMQKNINDLSWCLTRSNTLASLQRDSPYIHLIDLNWPGSEMDGEPHCLKRSISPFISRSNLTTRNLAIGDITWHPTDLERLLVLSLSGTLCDYKIPQRIAMSWNNNNVLLGTTGKELCRLNSIASPCSLTDSLNPWNASVAEKSIEDIAELIQRRALNDYGQMVEIQKNGDLAESPKLCSVWRLLAHMHRKGSIAGLKAILGISSAPDGPAMSTSETMVLSWADFPTNSALKVYRSEQRDFALQLCGWAFERDKEASFTAFIEDLCTKHEFTRASLIACFHLRIRYAIDILGKGAEQSSDTNTLRMAAIALAGFSQEKTGIWKSQCTAAGLQISDPHIRAIFAFLSPDNDNYDSVLTESGVTLSDRMAFACTFLSDAKLAEYIKNRIQRCITMGDLNGLLLTGAAKDGINLLQSYLDWTEDVQTVASVAARFYTHDLLSDHRVQYWVASYRDLLDKWGLWKQRAQLDMSLGTAQDKSPPKAARSVYLQCSFCGKSVSAYLQEDSRIRSNATNINKLSSCPNCRKPLPRCSLCLLHMGTRSGSLLQQLGITTWQSKPFSKWFSWCQTCRHGGHTEHLAEWFREHAECPVTACSCKCFAMDLPMPIFPPQVSQDMKQ